VIQQYQSYVEVLLVYLERSDLTIRLSPITGMNTDNDLVRLPTNAIDSRYFAIAVINVFR
jgi:hypothetical protein